MMKECSVVFVGLKSGFKFLEGKFHSSEPQCHLNEELESLCEAFKKSIQKDISEQSLAKAARRFLKEHSWKVIFSDYSEHSLDESLSETEAEDLVKKLKKGEVKFRFKKADGSTRTARGTLNQEVIKKGLDGVEKAKRSRHVPSSVIVYWDLDKEMFRSFRKDNFLKVINYKYYPEKRR